VKCENALGNMQTSQENFTTVVYAKFVAQCIKGNWKIINGKEMSILMQNILITPAMQHRFRAKPLLPCMS